MDSKKDIQAEDRRIRKTKKSVELAFAELLINKSINDITITEICKAADINRKTFYAHFSSPEDVYQYILKNIDRRFVEIQDQCHSSKGYDIDSSIYAQLESLNGNLELYRLLAKGTARDRLFHDVMTIMDVARIKHTNDRQVGVDKVRCVLRVIHAGYIMTICDWLSEPDERTYKDIAEFSISISKSIREVYKIDYIV